MKYTRLVKVVCVSLYFGVCCNIFADDFRINQVGYESQGPKFAVLETNSTVSTFQLVDALTNATIYIGTVGQLEIVQDWDASRKFYRMDFSDFTGSGEYFLKATGVVGQSWSFKIDSQILFKQTMPLTYDFFNKSRANEIEINGGTNWELWNTDKAIGFYNDAGKGTKDVTGGWYDASSDISKYLSHLNYGNVTMPQQIPMSAYAMSDIFERIPDQLNGLGLKSSMQDEALWGADYLVRILDAEGYFYTNVFDEWTGNLWQRVICSFEGYGGAEKSLVKTQEWQAGFREGAGISIAVLARVSQWNVNGVFTNTQYLETAIKAWDHLVANNFQKAKEYADDGILNFLDSYTILAAAMELYKATQNGEYLTAAEEQIDDFSSRLHAEGYFIADHGDRPFYHAADAGLPIVLLARFIDIAPQSSKVELARSVIQTNLDYQLRVTNNTINPFGYARQHIKTGGNVVNGYMNGGIIKESFFIPHDNETEYWWQGESARLSSLAAAALIGGRKIPATSRTAFGVSPELHQYALTQLSWTLGQNPYNMCMMDGVGYQYPGSYGAKAPWHTHLAGGISNGITGSLYNSDGSGIDWENSDPTPWPGNETWQKWRWVEQWIPHAHWFMMATAATVATDFDFSQLSSSTELSSSTLVLESSSEPILQISSSSAVTTASSTVEIYSEDTGVSSSSSSSRYY